MENKYFEMKYFTKYLSEAQINIQKYPTVPTIYFRAYLL